MPQQAWSNKRERQYEHIEESLEERGTPEDKAKEIAARTVNKARARSGDGQPVAKPWLRPSLRRCPAAHLDLLWFGFRFLP